MMSIRNRYKVNTKLKDIALKLCIIFPKEVAKVVTVEDVTQIIKSVEEKKETSLISSESETGSYDFSNSMPPKIADHLNSINDDNIQTTAQEIGTIAKELLKGL